MENEQTKTEQPSARQPNKAPVVGHHQVEAPNDGAAKPSGNHKLWIVSAVLVVIVIGIVWKVRSNPKTASGSQGQPGTEKGSTNGRPSLPPIPVVAGKAAQKDVPIYLDGLGTVQAFNTVTVRVRVDGQLQKINFTEGQDVHEGDVLAQIDPAPFQTQVDQAEAKKAQDEAQLSNARADLKRNSDLLTQQIVSQQVYDTQRAMVDQLAAAVKADEAAISSAKVQLAYTKILSPIDGRTGIRQMDQGNIVHANDPSGLVVIAQLRPISVVFTLPEQRLNDIHNQTFRRTLTILAMDRDNTTTLGEGTLTVIDNQIDTTTGTIKLKAAFPNTDLKLWPGQFVNARLRLTTRTNGVVVPASVIQRGPDGAYAFVIKPDLSVQIRPVKVAQMEGGEALIDEGLKAGDRVVVDGQYKLQTGSKVKPGQSAKAGEEEGKQ